MISISKRISSDSKKGQITYVLMIPIAFHEEKIFKERSMSGKITKAHRVFRLSGSNMLLGDQKNKKNEFYKGVLKFNGIFSE